MDHLIRELGHFGLSEKEAAVYLASLELGPLPVQDISHKAKVNRATTYVMIESLMNRGLMSSFIRGKKRYYAAESPDRLRAVLRMQRKELEQKEHEFEATFPMLAALYNTEGAKPQVRYMEGAEGVKTARETFVGLEGDIIQILRFDPDAPIEELEAGRGEHIRTIASQSVSYRALVVMDPRDMDKVPVWENLEVRAVARDLFPDMHAEITVRGDTVCLFSQKSTILAIIITSREIADAHRALFELAWKASEGFLARKT
jgi:sugar-specific transcriptional regulator TrmB